MTDLRTRIAAVMVKAMSEYGYCEELGSKTVVDAEIDFNTVADAVIRELAAPCRSGCMWQIPDHIEDMTPQQRSTLGLPNHTDVI